jgi:hypothetical protein
VEAIFDVLSFHPEFTDSYRDGRVEALGAVEVRAVQ